MLYVPQGDDHELSQCHSIEQHIYGPAVNTLTAAGIACIYSGVGAREWCRHCGQPSPRGSKIGSKINILNKRI